MNEIFEVRQMLAMIWFKWQLPYPYPNSSFNTHFARGKMTHCPLMGA